MAYMLVRRHNSAYWCHPKRRRNATASAHHGQAELHEPCTHADAQAAPRTVTQNSLPVQRYCIRATSSCNAPARVASLGDEVLNGSTEAQETGSEQPARGTATERYVTAPIARRSAAAVQQEADNGATDTDSRAQDPILGYFLNARCKGLFRYTKGGNE